MGKRLFGRAGGDQGHKRLLTSLYSRKFLTMFSSMIPFLYLISGMHLLDICILILLLINYRFNELYVILTPGKILMIN